MLASGWGSGFINTTLHNGATGENFGHDGATTVSFREGGDWAKVLKAAAAAVDSHTPYVTIQFGHNDQKASANISIAEFTANLVQFVKDVEAVKAIPVLVTSLSRRQYQETSSGERIIENLADVANAAKAAAKQSGSAIIDLNAASEKYLNAIGPKDAYTYNRIPTDYTHLNSEGSIVFGNMVASLLDAAIKDLEGYVSPEAQIAKDLDSGTYYFPPSCTGAFC